LAALAIPGLPFFWMPILLMGVLPALVLRRGSPLRLIWRTRWLLLVLLFGYAYSLPGEPLWSVLADYSPSREGCRHGLEQAARLVVLLLWLDLLVLRLPADALLAGLYQLFRPFSGIGLDPQRAALRLGLTLRAIEGLERGRGNLRSLLDADFKIELPSQVTLRLAPLRWTDIAMPALLGLGLLVVWLLAA
jgi:energy-coupling factor transporter transmembrane protein EcfT